MQTDRDGELADLQSTVTPIVFADHEIIFVKSDDSIGPREVELFIKAIDGMFKATSEIN